MPAVTVAATVASSPASAATSTLPGTGSGISYTLEGCRGSTSNYTTGPSSTYFPSETLTDTFLCGQTDYTTGNLGGGWNELDLVPGRVVVSGGNTATDPSFDFAVAVDNCSGSDGASGCTGTNDHPGYDQLSQLTLNNTLSNGPCGTISLDSPSNLNNRANPGYLAPGIGGTGTSLYEIMKVTGQGKNSTCVYDFNARLAFNSHRYPGSSLHYDLANSGLDPSQIGAKDVSIPVKSILPPTVSKVQNATQGSDYVWTIGKTVNHSTVSFSNTCDGSNPTSTTLQITVTWTRTVNKTGGITVTASITLTNNAHRAIDVALSDQLYDGLDQTTLDGSPMTQSVQLAAGETTSVPDIWTSVNTASSYNDIVTATYSDPLFGTILGSLTAAAHSNVQTVAPTSGANATIQDIETLTEGTEVTPDDFQFAVTSLSGTTGQFENSYTVNTKAPSTGYNSATVTWDSGIVSGSGSVTFNKTVYVTRATQDTATLADTATISPDQQDTQDASASTTINSAAQVSIIISKSTSVALTADKTFTFNAYASGTAPGGTIAGTTQITVPAGQTGKPSGIDGTISGLTPGTQYWINEPAVAPFPAQVTPPDTDAATDTASDSFGLNADGDADDTGISVSLPTCSVTVPVTNTAAPATAQVQKITAPNPAPSGSTNWTFTLTGTEPGVGGGAVTDLAGGSSEVLTGTTAVTANGGYFPFTSNLDQDGATYTITETEQTHWDPTTIVGDIGGVSTGRVTTSLVTATCSFTLNLTSDNGHIFECTFTNTLQSDVKVIKTQNGVAPTLQYSFELKNFDSTVPTFDQTLTTNSGGNIGTLDFGYLPPAGDPSGSDGKYTLCELAVPAGTLSSLAAFPGATTDPTTGNVCYTFTLQPGSDQTFNIDNSSPGGAQRTIGYWKHWNTATLGLTYSQAADCPLLPQGNFLMDCFLPQTLANASGAYTGYVVTTAAQGVSILSNPSSKYAENQLAAQLLAAELNVEAGASTCSGSINTVIAHAKSLLTSIGYTGPTSTVVGPKYSATIRNDFVNTAATLNTYNNGLLC